MPFCTEAFRSAAHARCRCGGWEDFPRIDHRRTEALHRINRMTGQLSGRAFVASPCLAEAEDPALSKAKQVAGAAIDAQVAALKEVSNRIHAKPELNFKEVYAHEQLTDFLEKQGFNVERGYTGLKTAFRATSPDMGQKGPTVVVCLEYDALPGIGHACGHNLISEAGLATAVGVKSALPEARLIVLGTPAEEGGGGKNQLMVNGAFEGVDCAMMVHPTPSDLVYFNALAVTGMKVRYTGRNAHAAASPWQGLNALDAMIHAFNGLSLARQQFKPDWRVHGVISKGGEKPNIIPDLTEANFMVRTPAEKDLAELKQRMVGVMEGAATATGCEVMIDWGRETGHYANMATNETMADLYHANATRLGKKLLSKEAELRLKALGGSTDMGNVSYKVPSIHPTFRIEAEYDNHHPGFTKGAAEDGAHQAAVVAGKAMAGTCMDLFMSESWMAKVREDFKGVDALR